MKDESVPQRQPQTPTEIDAWLTKYGWHPGRDIGTKADELIADVIQQYADEGETLEVIETAVPFIHSYGLLRASMGGNPSTDQIFTPIVAYEGEAEDIVELADNLGTKLFPLGYDTYDHATFLIDTQNRFFLQHHTGPYYLGSEKYEALANLLRSNVKEAEEFYV